MPQVPIARKLLTVLSAGKRKTSTKCGKIFTGVQPVVSAADEAQENSLTRISLMLSAGKYEPCSKARVNACKPSHDWLNTRYVCPDWVKNT